MNEETIRINKMIDTCSFSGLSYADLGRCEVLFIDRFYSNLLPTDIEKYKEDDVVEYASKVIFALADGYRNNRVHTIEIDEKVMMFVDSGVFKVEPKNLLITDIVIDRTIIKRERIDNLNLLDIQSKKDVECYFVNGSFIPELSEIGEKYDRLNILFRLAELRTNNWGVIHHTLDYSSDVFLEYLGFTFDIEQGKIKDYGEIASGIKELKHKADATIHKLNKYIFSLEKNIITPMGRIANGR